LAGSWRPGRWLHEHLRQSRRVLNRRGELPMSPDRAKTADQGVHQTGSTPGNACAQPRSSRIARWSLSTSTVKWTRRPLGALQSNVCSQGSAPTAYVSSLAAEDPCTPRGYANHTTVSNYEPDHCGRWDRDHRSELNATSRAAIGRQWRGGFAQVITGS
jgi:hypothetical protein